MEKFVKISKLLIGFIIGGLLFFKTLLPSILTSGAIFVNVTSVELLTLVNCTIYVLWMLFFKSVADCCAGEPDVCKYSSYGRTGALLFVISCGINFTDNFISSVMISLPPVLLNSLGLSMADDLETLLDIAGGVLMALAFYRLSARMEKGSNMKAATLATAIAIIAVTATILLWSDAPFMESFTLAKAGMEIWFLISCIRHQPFCPQDSAR